MNKLTAALAVAGISVASTVAAHNYPTGTIRYANFMPEGFTTSLVDQYVADEIAARTDGKVKVQMFHGGTLGGPGEMVDLVGAGAVDIGNFPVGYFFSKFPVSGLMDSLPMVFPTADIVAQLTREGIAEIPEAKAEYDAANLHPFLFRGLPQYRLICSKPVKTLEDFKGLKVRTFGTFHPMMFATLGAVPVNMELTETYEGLQRGAVDCVNMNYQAATLFNLFEVAKYTSDAEFGATPLFSGYVNKDVWESWSPEFQTLFNEVIADAEVKAAKEINAAEQEGLDTLLENGVELVPFEDQKAMEAAMPDFFELWVAKVAEAGKGEAAAKHAEFIKERLAELTAAN